MMTVPIAREDEELVVAIRAGDERAFATLVDRHSSAMVRVAMAYVPSRAGAEEVVQETWIAAKRAILRPGLRRGHGRALGGSGSFAPADHERFAGHWVVMPARWPRPKEGLLSGETREVIAEAIAGLPKAQRTVIALRDVEGWTSEEVCDALEISPRMTTSPA